MDIVQRYKEFSDEALMLEVKRGNHACFEELLRRYERSIHNFIFRQLGDNEIAKDLLMETFIRIFKAAERYEPRSKFSTYIYQIARNLCINEYKKRSLRKMDSLDALNEEAGIEFAGDGLDPEEEQHRYEQQRLVQQALESLPEDQRMILILSEFQGHSYERIAQIMNCTIGTVKSRMYRARHKIREWMENHGL